MWGIFTRNTSVNVIKRASASSNERRSSVRPSERVHQEPLRLYSESVTLSPPRWTESNKTRSDASVSDRVNEEDSSDVFGDYSRSFSSRRTFRKTSSELLDMRYRDDEEDRPVVQKFRSKTGRKNTAYWYFLQCKKLIKEDKVRCQEHVILKFPYRGSTVHVLILHHNNYIEGYLNVLNESTFS